MFDLDVLFQELGLGDGARDAVEEKKLLVREIPVCGNKTLNEVMPDPDGDIIREKMAFAGVRMVEFACRGLWGEASEDIS